MCKKYLISKETCVQSVCNTCCFFWIHFEHRVTWYRKSVPSTGQTRARWHMVALKWPSTRTSHFPISSSEHFLYQRYTVSTFQYGTLRLLRHVYTVFNSTYVMFKSFSLQFPVLSYKTIKLPNVFMQFKLI